MTIKKLLKQLWKNSQSTSDYWLTRFVFLRFLGFIYFFAFLSLVRQIVPLIGNQGLLPAANFLQNFSSQYIWKISAFLKLPSVFWFHLSDNTLQTLAVIGLILAFIVLIGFANAPIMFMLWLLYLSFTHVAQVWHGFGWDILLLETGFLSIFLVPTLDPRPFPHRSPPPPPIIWLLRWLTFRIYLGAGLIKIRGDQCWRDLTCMIYHYETQPILNPLSPFFHFTPVWFHKLETLTNHLVELIIPFFIFTKNHLRHLAAIALISFQLILILSGNLSFLNWLTLTITLGLLNDKFLSHFLPRFITRPALKAAKKAIPFTLKRLLTTWILLISIALMSLPVAKNLLSKNQAMNTSFNSLRLVNTYGAFGSVTKKRLELVILGTSDTTITQASVWQEYEFKYKPTSLSRPHQFIAPYQPRLDWQLWFAAFQTPQQNPWLINLVWKLLDNQPQALTFLASNPFPDSPPQFIRIDRYHYQLQRHQSDNSYWKRTFVDSWLPPLSLSSPELVSFITAQGWD